LLKGIILEASLGLCFAFREGYPPPFVMDSVDGSFDNQRMDTLRAALVAVVFTIAGVVKGISGMGLPTVAMSLLGTILAPAQAAALLVLPSLATNVVQCLGPHLRTLTRRLWPMWFGLVLASIFSPWQDIDASATNAREFLGALLVLYGLWGLWRPVLPRLGTQHAWPGLVAGALTGFITAATAVFVVPLVPYLQALRLEKGEMIQALGLSFTVATVALAIRLHAGVTLVILSPLTGLALLTAVAGIWLGGRLRSKLSQQMFQRALFVVFVALGCVNLWRSL
jgi:uncharacterized membrane protein YfcA